MPSIENRSILKCKVMFVFGLSVTVKFSNYMTPFIAFVS